MGSIRGKFWASFLIAASMSGAAIVLAWWLARHHSQTDPTAATVAIGASVAAIPLAVFAFQQRAWARETAGRHLQEIADRKRTEEALRLQSVALEAAANGIVITDRAGRIVWANAAFERMTGWTVAEIIGRTPSILRSGEHDDAFYRNLWNTIRLGDTWHGTLVNRRKDSSTYIEEMTITPVRDKAGKISQYIAIKQDITHRKESENALKAAKVGAEQANNAKDHFLAVLSHELRTPLSAVIPALEELQDRVTGDSAALLKMALRNVELEARLIDDLLDVTRIARGKIELDRHPVDLRTILRHAAEVCTPDVEARGIHFGVAIQETPQVIEADAARLQQVFWNLIKNAVKFTPRNGSVGVQCRRIDGHAVVEVADSGAGIEREAISRIFDAFEQEGRSTTRQFGGLGLGLAITRTLVELHGGRIWAHSQGKGKGSLFTVELPLAHAGVPCADHSDSTDRRQEIRKAARPSLRILLVEDHGDTARIISQLLRKQGHTVKHAGDVTTALSIRHSESFDLLLSDVGLPDRSGHDLVRELRARGDAIPAIALSGYGLTSDIQQSLAAGFAEHVTKPVNFHSLLAAIDRVTAPAAAAPGRDLHSPVCPVNFRVPLPGVGEVH